MAKAAPKMVAIEETWTVIAPLLLAPVALAEALPVREAEALPDDAGLLVAADAPEVAADELAEDEEDPAGRLV